MALYKYLGNMFFRRVSNKEIEKNNEVREDSIAIMV